MPGTIYQFGDFQLDCDRFELMRNGAAQRVERKPLELLILLVSREGRLVSRAEIAQRLWSSEVFVDTEHGINTAIRKLRYLLRDDPENPSFIQTVTGMGYRFIAAINLDRNCGAGSRLPPQPGRQCSRIRQRQPETTLQILRSHRLPARNRWRSHRPRCRPRAHLGPASLGRSPPRS